MATDLELYRYFFRRGRSRQLQPGGPRAAVHYAAGCFSGRSAAGGAAGSATVCPGTPGGRADRGGGAALSACLCRDAAAGSGEQKLRRVQNLEAGQLKLGAADTTTKELLLPYISAFHQLHPRRTAHGDQPHLLAAGRMPEGRAAGPCHCQPAY